MVYNKLVRDLIPEWIVKKGKKPVTRIATDAEMNELLHNKLLEEVQEFLAATSHEHSVEELADVMEVVAAWCKRNNVTAHDIEQKRVAKAKERGGFTKNIVLIETIE